MSPTPPAALPRGPHRGRPAARRRRARRRAWRISSPAGSSRTRSMSIPKRRAISLGRLAGQQPQRAGEGSRPARPGQPGQRGGAAADRHGLGGPGDVERRQRARDLARARASSSADGGSEGRQRSVSSPDPIATDAHHLTWSGACRPRARMIRRPRRRPQADRGEWPSVRATPTKASRASSSPERISKGTKTGSWITPDDRAGRRSGTAAWHLQEIGTNRRVSQTSV